ncbi:tripartite tricarboxylate transporter substrate binding protein [Vineibacter terrae]|uniref:Bug family tripartite tricarboxylate transporter substrate binding protein n=1 Tax=Vineibacter terrae TaxID=2586908 RepID=UPI002E358D0F|nr:tripartite tricarboxylate transporter substrate binding protein [Vineibacter terrae]HEX2887081.1 tripartite tricarboxylate transporter substrate binding protein [Vineibacter terrae]
MTRSSKASASARTAALVISRRRAVWAGALCAAGMATAGAFAADTWPSRPLRIIVPFPPGGGADGSARVLAEVMGPQLGQNVIVENRPGAGSAIGVTAAAQSRDGHTLLMGSNSMVINPALQPAIGYDVERDFDAVGMVSAQPLVLVVPAASSIQSLEGLLAEARAKPGQLSTGNSGYGTLAHLASELFAAQTGTTLTPVPYKGESALMPDLIGGLVSAGFLNLPSVIAHVRSGRLRALAVSAPQPVPDLPGVPTFRALKYPGLEVQGWAAMLAPKDTIAAEGLGRLERLLAAALASEPVQKRFAALGVTPTPLGRQATGQFLRDEAARYAAVIKARNIKVD